MKKNVLKGIIATASITALSMAMAGCSADDSSNVPKPPKPTDKNCNNWQWDNSLGVWQCKDSNSSYHGNYFYGGHYYTSSDNLKSSPSYTSYSKSSSFAGESAHSSTSESVSSAHEGGFGGHGGGGE